MKKLLTSILIGLAFTSYADMNDVSNNPIYFDLSGGIMNSISNDTNTSFATSLDAGYMFNNYFGLEGGFIYSPVSVQSPVSSYNTMNYYAIDAAIKGVLPLNNVFAMYGKLGITQNWFAINGKNGGGMDSTTSSIGGLIGAGVQFNLNKNWSLHLEDDYIPVLNPVSGADNPNLVMMGGEFRF